MSFALLRERLRNYPGRVRVNHFFRGLRRTGLDLLPSVGPEGRMRVVYGAEPRSRWAPFSADALGPLAERAARDRESTTAEMRVFEGDLTLDSYSRELFDRRRVIKNSFDLVGRRREPRLSSYLFGPTLNLGEFVSLRGQMDYTYYHFLCDTMMKVFLAERFAPSSAPFVVHESLARQPFFEEARGLGVFGARAVVAQGEGQRFGAGRVWVPTHGEPTRADLLEIARRFGADRAPAAPAVRIYLSRGPKAQNRRHLRNERALFEQLRDRGFQFFDAQEHSLTEQIQMFACAEIVVAPHGAGLANVIWRQTRPMAVVELVNPSMHTLDMAYMSVALGHRHCLVENRGDLGRPSKSTADADIPAVLARVDEAMAWLA
ncbi:MAG: DUF563 domain-containing protein [Amphiplicatus sp.]